MTTIPNDWPRWVGEAVASGADVVIESERGGTDSFSGDSRGAGQSAVGDDVRLTVQGTPLILDAGTFRGHAIDLSGPTPYLMVPGVGMILLGAWCLYRGAFRPAMVSGGVGVGIVGLALNPWIGVVAIFGILAGVLWYFRDSVALADSRRALKAVVSEVDGLRETAPAVREAVKAGVGRRVTPKAEAEIQKARGKR
jgi:hypothetical protein